MFAHQCRKTRIDHCLADRLEDMNQIEIDPCTLGDDPRPIGNSPTHRSEINAGYNSPQKCHSLSTTATLTSRSGG